MAKIIQSKIDVIPSVIIVGDKIDDIKVSCDLWFHPKDIELGITYLLQVLIYDTRGGIDIPVILPNWDQTEVATIENGRKDDYLGATQKTIEATEEHISISLNIALQLGVLNPNNTYNSRHLRAFISLLPCIGRSVQWTEQLEVDVHY